MHKKNEPVINQFGPDTMNPVFKAFHPKKKRKNNAERLLSKKDVQESFGDCPACKAEHEIIRHRIESFMSKSKATVTEPMVSVNAKPGDINIPPASEKKWKKPYERATGYRKGNLLGKGAYKTAYDMADDPTKVLLVYTRNDYNDPGVDQTGFLRAEAEMLDNLQNLGIPTLPVYEIYRTKDTRESVMVVEKLIPSARGQYYDRQKKIDANRKLLEVVGPESRASAWKIINAVKNSLVYIGDFQYLFDKQGRIYVCDPLSVEFQSLRNWSRANPPVPLARYSFGTLELVETLLAFKEGKIKLTDDQLSELEYYSRNMWHGKIRKLAIDAERAEELYWASRGVETEEAFIEVDDQ